MPPSRVDQLPHSTLHHPAPEGEFHDQPRPRWIARAILLRSIASAAADPALRDELQDLAPDTTDDLDR